MNIFSMKPNSTPSQQSIAIFQRFAQLLRLWVCVLVRTQKGFIFQLVCLFLGLFLLSITRLKKVIEHSNMDATLPCSFVEKNFFQVFEFQFFFKFKTPILENFKVIFFARHKSAKKVIVFKFGQNSPLANALLTEHVKTYFEFFPNFNFFKVQKSIV